MAAGRARSTVSSAMALVFINMVSPSIVSYRLFNGRKRL